MPINNLRILNWNANGIQNNKKQLQLVLTDQKIDVCFISETHLTNKSYLKIKDYEIYHTPHPDNQAHGGSAVLIRNNIKHVEEQKMQQEDIQLAVISVTTKQNIRLGAVYIPPKHNLKTEDYKKLLKHMGERFIIGGDFNAKHSSWGSRLDNTKGKELFKATQLENCNIHATGNPTYWPTDHNKIPDSLDFFISRKIANNFIKIEDNLDLDSDHTAQILTMSNRPITKQTGPTLGNKTTDWNAFKCQLTEQLNCNVKLRTKEQLDIAVSDYTKLIQKAVWDNTKQLSNNKVEGKCIPMEIKKLVNEKRKLRRKWQNSRNPAIKTQLNNKAQQIKRILKELDETATTSFLENLSSESSTNYSLWKITKKLTKKSTPIPPISVNNEWARTEQQKADSFADLLENTFTPNKNMGLDPTLQEHNNQDNSPIKYITLNELKHEIKTNLNPRKAPGFDLITGQIIKLLPEKGIRMLLILYNAAIRLKHVPDSWKIAEMIMIAKPGKDPNQLTSYRPISLLPIMSKLFEKLILKRMTPIIEEKKLIPNHQFGFRRKHSTIEQVHRITAIIEEAIQKGEVCSAIFLDVAQAFDKVWHKGLLYKLNKILPSIMVQLLESYITERMFRVRQGETYSDLKSIKAGVPQGSVLGPILYVLFTYDLPEIPGVTSATFADDTANLAVAKTVEESTTKLKKSSDLISEWTKKWRIRLNDSKAIHINFTNKRIKDAPKLVMNGTTVPHHNSAKYLGMNLDAKLKWNEHIKIKIAEMRLKYRQLYWLMGRNSKVSVYNKILLYNQVLKPIWAYGIQLWGCAAQSHINKIQRFQNKVLRNAVNAPWYIRNIDLHKDLKVPMVHEVISHHATKHQRKLLVHTNEEATQLLNISNQTKRLKRKTPFDLI
jgi:hypothetical protein